MKVCKKYELVNGEKVRVGEYHYDDKGNTIYEKDPNGTEYFWEYKYDNHGNTIYEKDPDGTEYFWEYDYKGNKIYQKYPDGDEWFWKYDDHGNKIYRKNLDGEKYFWEYKYDDKGNMIYEKTSDGDEWFMKYDYKGNKIYQKEPDGSEYFWEYEYDIIHTNQSLFAMMDFVEFPEQEQLVSGLQEGVMYDHVSSMYLNGCINYVDIISAFMVRHYMTPDEWVDACSRIDNNKEFHTNISDTEKYDDVIILAESGNKYLIFWNNGDCSDCSIGMISKYNFQSNEDAIDRLKISIKEDIIDETWDKNVKEIPREFFTGWITL